MTGVQRVFGSSDSGPIRPTMRIHDPRFIRRLVRRPRADAWRRAMSKRPTRSIRGTLREFLEILLISTAESEPSGFIGHAIAKTRFALVAQ